ncbi:MAG: 1-(5-phosphoribosyl)-5-amino-4-imidazole-carboxylate carboxylase, partial [Thermodesulfobacteriota bacterium]|nr:1-(5-phosphoribosyl)-5-amino-4-imidazole-carboxylate carboxylase [Thermodesulfobacteriota bacterium]
MKTEDIRKVLEQVKQGSISITTALQKLKTLPLEDIGFATLDHHRTLRKGFPEVIWGEGKTSTQIVGIIKKMLSKKHPILVTRVDTSKAASIKRALPSITYHKTSRLVTLNTKNLPNS